MYTPKEDLGAGGGWGGGPGNPEMPTMGSNHHGEVSHVLF